MEDPTQAPEKPFRPPPLPLGSRCPPGGGLPRGPGRPGKPKGLPLALDLPSKKEESQCGQVFSMATPRGESKVDRHYMGTPRASSILSAFLDFDESDVGGPPLDIPDEYCAVGISGFAPPLDFDDDDLAALVERHSAKKQKQETDDSISSGSTRIAEGEDGSAASSPEDEAETPGKAVSGQPTFALDDDDDDGDEDYEEDFEEDSDSESDDEA